MGRATWSFCNGWPVFWPTAAACLLSLVATHYFGPATGVPTALLASLLVTWHIVRQHHRAVRELSRQIDRLADADFDRRLYLGRHSVLAPLARSVNETTERLAERFHALDAKSQQLRTILTGMVEGVVALDGAQQIIFANEPAERWLSLPTEAVGRSFRDVVRNRRVLELVDRANAELFPCHAELDFAGSTAQRVLAHVARLPNGAGQVIVLHDVTDIRRLERLRQEFVANVSHELKTPLAIIVACCETLQDGALDDLGNRDTFLNRIAEQTRRLQALISDMLTLARLEATATPLPLAPTPLDEVARACVDDQSDRAQRLSIQLTADGPTGQSVLANEGALRQILDNLIDNSLRYTLPGGSIAVVWRPDGDQVALDVRDTGIGIPAHSLPRIFERFYRVDQNRARESGGTGLGLAIVKHLTHAMGGSVTAASREGQGTTLTVRVKKAVGDESSSSVHTHVGSAH